MSVVSPEQFAMLKFANKDFKNIQKHYKKFHDINSSKYLAVYKQGLYGILDVETENLVVPHKYQKICDFTEDFAWVKAKNKWGFINKNLVEIVPPKYTDAFGLDNGNFQLGVIHCVGNPKIANDLSILTSWYKENRKKNPPILYNRIQGFSEGLMPVKLRKKWGFINTDGKLVIKPRFEYVKPFSFGTSAVCLNGKWGFINNRGNFVIKPQYADCTSFMKKPQALAPVALKRPAHNAIIAYLYNMFKKVYVPTNSDAPFAQVEIPSEDIGKIKVACIDTTGSKVKRSLKKEIEVHSEIY